MPAPPFHLALPVDDLAAAREFYVEQLGCKVGRSSANWIDFDFFGHQLTVHQSRGHDSVERNAVDGDQVPVRHFGVVLPLTDWEALRGRLQARSTQFLIEPRIRFRGEVGEQHTFFLTDPSGNALEFKSFQSPDALFAS